jgi:hypothetical protein
MDILGNTDIEIFDGQTLQFQRYQKSIRVVGTNRSLDMICQRPMFFDGADKNSAVPSW